MMRRITVGALTLLLAVSVFSWIYYIPADVLNPLRPVPAHAHIIYRSTSPSRFLSSFPNLGKGVRSGVKPWEKSLQVLERNPLTVATVSLGGRDRRDAWVAVSAIGPRAVLLRWRLALAPPEGVKLSRSYGAWPVWEYSDASLPIWMHVRFSVVEGLLICSISDDSHDIYYLLDTLDGRRPSAVRKDD